METVLPRVRAFALDWRYFSRVAALLWALDALLSIGILWRVPCPLERRHSVSFARVSMCSATLDMHADTEIDWIAYMQEVEGWAVHGHKDYTQLRGDTGPLVYPAGFLYVYSALRRIVGNGGRGEAAIWIAQMIFLGVYLATQAVVLRTMQRAKISSPWIAVLLVLSKRIHSLYFLRLFNDCIEMLLVHLAIYCYVNRNWLLGSVLFSIGLSIKMNALLFLPGILYLLTRNVGVSRLVSHVAVMLLLQVVIGSPFLFAYPESYLNKAFELNRVFFHQWTVNLKFLPEAIFISRPVALLLLGGHLGALVLFAAFKWSAIGGGLWAVLRAVGLLPPPTETIAVASPARRPRSSSRTRAATVQNTSPSWLSRLRVGAFNDPPAYVLYVLYTSNFVGIVFARTLHYQFYTWYFHTLPVLLAVCTPLPWLVRLAALAGIEYAFNVGDASGAGSAVSSAVLQAAHAIILAGVAAGEVPNNGSDTSGGSAKRRTKQS